MSRNQCNAIQNKIHLTWKFKHMKISGTVIYPNATMPFINPIIPN